MASSTSAAAAVSAAPAPSLAAAPAAPPLAHPDMALWQQRVQDWYPKWRERTYFVPAVYMHRTQYRPMQLSGQDVHVTDPPVTIAPTGKSSKGLLWESDTRDDQTTQRVLQCLHQIAEAQSEVMFVLSQLEYVHYLNEPSFATAAALLPRPLNLKAQNQHRGDFDMLIANRKYGLLVMEIKAVGDGFPAHFTQQQRDQPVTKKVTQAVKQLQKGDVVAKHMVSDQQTPPRVSVALVVPNVSTAQLQQILASNPKLNQDLCQCVGVASTVDPTPLCLTADGMNNPVQWWQRRMIAAGIDPAMTDNVYLDLISRFSGPATKVEVFCTSLPPLGRNLDLRAEGECAAETGWRFTQLVLHPCQVAAVNNNQPLVHLTGPPGTGKSLVLLMKGLGWVRQNLEVQIVSTQYESLASSYMVARQLEETAGPAAAPLIHLHSFNLRDGVHEVQAAVTALTNASQGGHLYVIVDEIFRVGSGPFADVCNDLLRQVPGLHLWSASVRHGNRPPILTEIVLTEPLRTPPSITREIEQCESMTPGGSVHPYTAVPGPLPCDGPTPRVVIHAGPNHGFGLTIECEECGREVGRILKDELQVGTARTTAANTQQLHYRDVFLLTFKPNLLLETQTDATGTVTQPATAILRGVRDVGVPVTVLQRGDAVKVVDVARVTTADEVIASDSGTISGLERQVVVFIQRDVMGAGTPDENYGRRDALSRCTAQLIWVRPP